MKANSLEDVFENSEESKNQKLTAKEVMLKYVAYFPLFVLSLSLFLVAAFLYLRYAVPVYTVNTTLLIKDDQGRGGSGSDELESMIFLKKSINLDNEIEILRSQTLVRRVVDSLDFNYSYENNDHLKSTFDIPFSARPITVGSLLPHV